VSSPAVRGGSILRAIYAAVDVLSTALHWYSSHVLEYCRFTLMKLRFIASSHAVELTTGHDHLKSGNGVPEMLVSQTCVCLW
jgi:hypothetical protein